MVAPLPSMVTSLVMIGNAVGPYTSWRYVVRVYVAPVASTIVSAPGAVLAAQIASTSEIPGASHGDRCPPAPSGHSWASGTSSSATSLHLAKSTVSCVVVTWMTSAVATPHPRP